MSRENGRSGPMATMISEATRRRDVVTHWVCDRVGATCIYNIIGQTPWNAGTREQIHRSGFVAASTPEELVDEIRKEFEAQEFPVHVNGGHPLVDGASSYGIAVYAAPEV